MGWQVEINRFAKLCHKIAGKKGWHDIERSALEFHALIHSEISEATESVRNREPPLFFDHLGKPDGEAVELADAIIRIADYFVLNGWDLNHTLKIKADFNETRPYRHGGKAY